jgi:hypothetical protein
VQLHLEVELVGDRKTGVDHRRHRAPVLVDLEADAAAGDLVENRARPRGVAAAEQAKIDRPFFRRLQHLADVERAAAVDADRDRPERAADHGRQSRRDGVLAKLRGVEMHMDIDAARRRDHAFRIAHHGGRADDQLRMHAVHGRGVAGLADGDDLAVLDADVALDDAEHRIDHERVAEQHVERAHGELHSPAYHAILLIATLRSCCCRSRSQSFWISASRGWGYRLRSEALSSPF